MQLFLSYPGYINISASLIYGMSGFDVILNMAVYGKGLYCSDVVQNDKF